MRLAIRLLGGLLFRHPEPETLRIDRKKQGAEHGPFWSAASEREESRARKLKAYELATWAQKQLARASQQVPSAEPCALCMLSCPCQG